MAAPDRSSPRRRLRGIATTALGSSYGLSKRVAQSRMSSSGGRRVVVLSMGKTGSTAIARAAAEATGTRVLQVFRLDRSRLAAAEARYRRLDRETRRLGHASSPSAFPGALHLWESDFLLRHPPTEEAPWDVITTVREPVAQAVSAFFHAALRLGELGDNSDSDADLERLARSMIDQLWLRRPTRWFEREFAPALGIDVYEHPFDPAGGYAIIETPALRVLLLRQESFSAAPHALREFLSLHEPVPVPARNEGSRKEYASAYGEFLEGASFPEAVLNTIYATPYARHFYSESEIVQMKLRWAGPRISSD